MKQTPPGWHREACLDLSRAALGTARRPHRTPPRPGDPFFRFLCTRPHAPRTHERNRRPHARRGPARGSRPDPPRAVEPGARPGTPALTRPLAPKGGSAVRPPPSASAWLLAARLKTLPAAAAPVFIGTGLAALRGVLAPLPALAALVGALLIQVATNLANDYYDFLKGADTEARVGPVRVTQAGLISPDAVKRGMLATLAAALLVGTYLVWVGGWPIVVIGLASLVCAVAYTGGPFPLAYHGLGDLFVFVFFGLVAVSGTYYVQGGVWAPEALLAGVGVGALSTAILVVNNLRDIDTDALAGKRTLAVRLGRRGSQAEYLVLVAAAGIAPALGVVLFGWPAPALAASVLVAALTVRPARRVLGFTQPRELLPALAETARAVAVYGVVLGVALALGS